MKGRIWTVPNQITFLRLGFLPFFLIFMSYEKYKWALLILVIAGFSDGIDGLIARKFNRSEEHTSELQSQSHLVCRLLLEKKKIVLIVNELLPEDASDDARVARLSA